MNKTRWRKVLRDLWGNKTRTLLVVLSIAIGVFAVGMIRGTQIMLREDMQAGYTETNPASAILFTELINPDIVQALKRIDGVEDVEGRRDFDMRIKTGPDTWRTIKFNIMDDYNNIRLDKFWPQEGAWPPTKKGMLLERGSLELANAAIGDSVTIEMSNGKTRSLTVDGTAHNMNAEPVQFTGEPVAFITKEAAQWLGISNAIDQIYISVSENKLDEEHIREVANRVEAKL
ncbi:MAG: ABC transporter permease, partial [Methylococcales bacterium]|nr:ABC transporter permease [Methylococcales bacterium]